MSDQEELDANLALIAEGKANFGENEQNIIDAWVAKLSEARETDEENVIRSEYVRTLARLTTEEKQLLPPFSEMPFEGELTPLSDMSSAPPAQKTTFQIRKMPCANKKPAPPGASPKSKRREISPPLRDDLNEFSDPEEMAKVIARSKGQSFADFVISISRHTADFGQVLKTAMKVETSDFKEFVENVLSQRIKDLTEVLDEEQNAELQRIKKDIDKWQLELSHCKKRIKEMIPDFDLEAYRKDRNYIKKYFSVSSTLGAPPEEDSFKKWKEESCHRLKWYSEMIYRLTRCNDGITQEITDVKSKTLDLEAREAMKQQCHIKHINCEVAEYQRLKEERDRLHKENAEYLSQLEDN